LVVLHACLTFASRSSVEVRVEVEVENLMKRARVNAMTGYFIMVAVDEEGKPTAVPPLTPCTEEEERSFNQALVRYRARSARPDRLKDF
jgi:acyl-CoA hydrolase